MLAFIGVAAVGDLAKEFVRHETMVWLSEKLGPFGTFLIENVEEEPAASGGSPSAFSELPEKRRTLARALVRLWKLR